MVVMDFIRFIKLYKICNHLIIKNLFHLTPFLNTLLTKLTKEGLSYKNNITNLFSFYESNVALEFLIFSFEKA